MLLSELIMSTMKVKACLASSVFSAECFPSGVRKSPPKPRRTTEKRRSKLAWAMTRVTPHWSIGPPGVVALVSFRLTSRKSFQVLGGLTPASWNICLL